MALVHQITTFIH